MKNKKNIYRFLFLLVGLGVLGFMVYKIGVSTILEGLSKMGWWFLAIIVLWLFIYILNAISWNIIIRDEDEHAKPSLLSVLRITISGFAINYITPVVGLGGEPYKIFELKDYMNTQKATSSVILYSMMHMFTHITFWMSAIVLAFFYLPLSWFSASLLILLFLIFVMIVILFLRGYKKGLLVSTLKLFHKLPFVRKFINKLDDSKWKSLREIDVLIAHLHTHRRSSFYWSFLTEFASRYVGCFEVTVIMMALAPLYPDLNINVMDAVIITAGYSLFANMVFFIPMQMGSREGGYLLAFEAIALPSAPAIIISLVTRIRELFWILIGLLFMRIGGGKRFKQQN